MEKSSLHFKLLGTSFSIAADEDSIYLETLLQKYKSVLDNTQKATGIEDPLKLAILTGFLLCGETNKLKLQMKEEQAATEARLADDADNAGEVNRITQKLIERIDRVIEEIPLSINDT